jgi:cobalt-zinc-cadmium efflux system protein
MSAGHSHHGHAHGVGSAHAHGAGGGGGDRAGHRKRLGWTLALVAAYMGAEVVGGLLANSLALLADAGHMLSDALSLGLALFALRMAERPATDKRTFGYHRAEILAALVNGVTLVVVSGLIFREAWERFQDPPEVDGGLLMGVAAGGLVVNLAGLFLLHGGRSDSLNMRGAWLHVLADALGSFQALVAGALVLAFGWRWVDPAVSVVIGLLVLWSSWSLLKESVDVLMESAPRGLDVDRVTEDLQAIDGVVDLHDLHAWTITSGFPALSAHVRIAGPRTPSDILEEIRHHLTHEHGVSHSTIQIESEEFGPCVGCGEAEGARV